MRGPRRPPQHRAADRRSQSVSVCGGAAVSDPREPNREHPNTYAASEHVLHSDSITIMQHHMLFIHVACSFKHVAEACSLMAILVLEDHS
jgi:hypothetical protein